MHLLDNIKSGINQIHMTNNISEAVILHRKSFWRVVFPWWKEEKIDFVKIK